MSAKRKARPTGTEFPKKKRARRKKHERDTGAAFPPVLEQKEDRDDRPRPRFDVV